MFAPKWKKDAKHLIKGARKFVDYKRDLLAPDRIAEIESRQDDLRAAIAAGDRAKVDEASKQLRVTCENSLPNERPLGWFEENVEVMFVAIVIALGLRAYYLQPFRIPTGSMQPTLNGIVGTPLPEAKWPSFPTRMAQKALKGRTYVKLVNDQDRHIAVVRQGNMEAFDIRDTQFMHFFSRAVIFSSDAPPIRLPAPKNPCGEIGLNNALEYARGHQGLLPKGFVICEGFIDSGDLVLVDKYSYHFRKPKRGEVFVFETRGIMGIIQREQEPGSHYIKRLAGVPGDTLSIQPPYLLVDGKIAKEAGFKRVEQAQGPYSINPEGYGFADGRERQRLYNGVQMPQYLAGPDDRLTLADQARPGYREYAALGDNTGNSLDSRYWGTVKEYNLVGPALFVLWPITSGHWGFIR